MTPEHFSTLPVRGMLAFLAIVVLLGARYLLMAGGALLGLALNRTTLAPRRIQPVDFTPAQMWREFAYSLSTVFIFAGVIAGVLITNHKLGLFRIYQNISDYGWAWFIASLPAAVLVHDFYFYWTHRFMHLPGVFERVHRVHHLSTNPSPLAAFAFHPLEALIEIGSFVLIAALIPMHPLALSLFALYSLATNVMGHLGYELLPRSLITSPRLSWLNTATSHNLHHRTFNGNFGLYTLLWDRFFGTLHPQDATLRARMPVHITHQPNTMR